MEQLQVRKGSYLAIVIAIFGVILTIAQFVFWDVVLKRITYNHIQEKAYNLASDISSRVNLFYRDAYVITKNYALNFLEFKKLKIPRYKAYSFLKGSLTGHSNFLALWTQWEPNAYDGLDNLYANDGFHDSKGHFTATFFLCDTGICCERNDTDFYSANYYLLPKKYKKAILLDPFFYQYKGNSRIYYETSLVYPIIDKGQFLGVTAVDIDLNVLSKLFRTLYVKHGKVGIISNNGTIVFHSDSSFFNHNIKNYFEGTTINIEDSIKKENEFSAVGKLNKDKDESFFYFFPINDEFIVSPWFVMVQYSKSAYFKELKLLITISLIFTIASILLIAYLVYNIIDRRKNEKILINAYKELSDSKSKLQIVHDELDANHQILTSMFNQTFTYVSLLSPSGKILRANNTFLEFIGKKESDILSCLYYELVCCNYSDEIRIKVKEAIENASKGMNVLIEADLIDKNKNKYDALISIRPIYNKDLEEVIFLLVEVVDITQLKKIEQQLREYQNHLEELVNERTKEVLQLNEELISTNEELKTTNEVIIEKNKELEDAISKLHHAQELLIINEKMASLGIFTAGIAHEINNPLNYITVSVSQLFECFEHFKDELVQKKLDVCLSVDKYEKLKVNIETGLARITEIISSLRNYSHTNQDKFIKYNIVQCMYDAKTLLFNKYKNRILFEENIDDIPEITCNPGKINQMFVNLFTNAIDAIEGEGMIKVFFKNINNKKIEIEVADNGCGIEENNLARIFDPFYTTKTVGKGTGLGLYIVYNIVEQHHGKISVQSKVGEGTKIKIILPIR